MLLANCIPNESVRRMTERATIRFMSRDVYFFRISDLDNPSERSSRSLPTNFHNSSFQKSSLTKRRLSVSKRGTLPF